MTIPVSEVVRLCKLRLEPVAGEEALQQAKEIVAAVIGAETSALAVHSWVQVTEEQMSMIGDLVEQRLSGQPLQYILGEWEFYGLPFYVDERALIPRQDTELLVETAISMIQQRGYQSCLDLCTGSGCIGIAAAVYLPDADVDLADVSPAALAVAARNIAAHGLEDRVRVIESDLFAGLEGQRFDLIVANPPYVGAAELAALPPEYHREPRLGLAGGESGLDLVLRILRDAPDHLTDDGLLICEVGEAEQALVELLPELPLAWVEFKVGQMGIFVAERADLVAHHVRIAELAAARG